MSRALRCFQITSELRSSGHGSGHDDALAHGNRFYARGDRCRATTTRLVAGPPAAAAQGRAANVCRSLRGHSSPWPLSLRAPDPLNPPGPWLRNDTPHDWGRTASTLFPATLSLTRP